MRISFLPLAQAELNGAIDYYNSKRAGLGEEFRVAVDDALAVVRQFPLACAPQPVSHQTGKTVPVWNRL